ncbi:hypothetical protein C922_05489 [Plasmodium inui San Antonio 1]|uniref:Uncharacterized protein n=1 Tax=Plasmodium inui San Antonio 1 TaxID=1237626 RepID=W6ZXY1_9APIC|nr:hypothetical protein C922_05489 [Plasmodium inui San Antonio 1]EUD64130.1 hypothetical protein C922_05489 [Plasmodium inui San Antonio 1]
MGELKLNSSKGVYEYNTKLGQQDKCGRTGSPYCLGKYGGQGGALPGFLGGLARQVEKLQSNDAWGEISGAQHDVVKEMKHRTENKFKWKGIIGCVMEHAMSLKQITASIGGKSVVLWDQGNWNKVLRGHTQENWGNSALGQAMLTAVVCTMRALYGQEKGQEALSADVKDLCSGLWEELAVELDPPNRQTETAPVKTLGEFLKLIRGDQAGEKSKFARVGFLLSVYYGMRECCEYSKKYSFTGLLRKDNYDLKQLSTCFMDEDQLKCESGGTHQKGTGLNLWHNSHQIMITREKRVTKGPLHVRNPTTGETIPPSQSSYREEKKKNTESGEPIGKRTGVLEEGTAKGKGRDRASPEGPIATTTASGERETAGPGSHRSPGEKGPKGSGEPGPAGVSPPPNQAQTTISEFQSGDTSIGAGEPTPPSAASEATQVQKPRKEEETTGRPRDDMAELKEVPGNGPTEAENVGNNLVPQVIGGILGIVLALASAYASYRIYFRRGSRKRISQTETGKVARITYGISNPANMIRSVRGYIAVPPEKFELKKFKRSSTMGERSQSIEGSPDQDDPKGSRQLRTQDITETTIQKEPPDK